MQLKVLLSVFILSTLGLTVHAQESSSVYRLSGIEPFRLYKDVGALNIKVPTVVEMPITDKTLERLDFAVHNNNSNVFEPYYFVQTKSSDIPFTLSTNISSDTSYKMIDGDVNTNTDFWLPATSQGRAVISISAQKPITSSQLSMLLDNNVALPNSIEIKALVSGQERIVLATQSVQSTQVLFPKTTSSQWEITLVYGQPLRIGEFKLSQDNSSGAISRSIRFLAQPNNTYKIYLNADRMVSLPYGESGNLSIAKDILKIKETVSINNPSYRIADIDGDDVPDINDNCVGVYNKDQKDVNDNGRGDTCDDFDQDGISNSTDNCPDYPNKNQSDKDSDNIGDVCDNEESRITEKYPWIPWLGMGFAGIVLIGLMVLMIRSKTPSAPINTP